MKKISKVILFLLLVLAGDFTLFEAHAVPLPKVSANVFIREFFADSLNTIIRQQSGHPFVLVIWSLDCEYCQASLDLLSEEKKAHPNLRVVTLSSDTLSDPQSVILMKTRLSGLGLRANAWAFSDAPPEQLRYVIDPKWHGEMPRSYWFNAEGVSTGLSGTVTHAAVMRFFAQH